MRIGTKASRSHTAYLTIRDAKTRRVECTTVYGLTPRQIVKLIRRGVEAEIVKRALAAQPEPSTTSGAA